MYAGTTHTEKIQQVQSHLRTTGAAALVLSMLDEVRRDTPCHRPPTYLVM